MASGINKIQPAVNSEAITLNQDHTRVASSYYVAAAGDVSVKHKGGNTTVYPNIAAGTWMPVSGIQITTAGTTVTSPGTNIIALFT